MPNDRQHRYNVTAEKSATAIISKYSTSFSLATQFLSPAERTNIQNLYAVVRIADEIVDGAAKQSGLNPTEVSKELDRFEQEILKTIKTGFSPNLAVHAFAKTVHTCNIPEDHIKSFFDSMRSDLSPQEHTAKSLRNYIYGSAEVIGLMCLAIFVNTPQQYYQCEKGARHLGAAFQKINFLRDIKEDTLLGRYYLGTEFNDDSRDRLVEEINTDLALAYRSIPLLPRSSRTGVLAAYLLFQELNKRLSNTPTAEIANGKRIRVPAALKIKLTTQAAIIAPRMKES